MVTTETSTRSDKAAALKTAWAKLAEETPNLRAREIAKRLNASEAELIACKLGENNAVRLKGPWQDILKRLPELGFVMSLTRNEACVLEHKGTFEEVSVFGEGARSMATVIGPIETRVFFSGWAHGFYLPMPREKDTLHSLQFFDAEGTAVTKIFLQKESDKAAFDRLVADFTSEDQAPGMELAPYEPKTFADEIDKAAFQKDWSEMTDTHQFFGMLKNHNIHRLDALHLVEGQFTQRLHDKSVIMRLLNEAAGRKIPIMIFAGNRGNLQIHQDYVRHIKEMGTWYNVLDSKFNMHLQSELIDELWVVRKPTSDGDVTSIEVFDTNRELAVQFFGLRKPGTPELSEWRELVAELSA